MTSASASLVLQFGAETIECNEQIVNRSPLLGRCAELGGPVRLAVPRRSFEAWLHGRLFKGFAANLKVYKVARFLEADDAAKWAIQIFARPHANGPAAVQGAAAAAPVDPLAYAGTPAALRMLSAQHDDIIAEVIAAHPIVTGSQHMAFKLRFVSAWPQALRDAALPQLLPLRDGERGLLLHMRDPELCAALLSETAVLRHAKWVELVGSKCPPAVYGTAGVWPTAPCAAIRVQQARCSKRHRGEQHAPQAAAAAAVEAFTMVGALEALPASVADVTVRAIAASEVAAVSEVLSTMALTRLTLCADAVPDRWIKDADGRPAVSLLGQLRACPGLQQLCVTPYAERCIPLNSRRRCCMDLAGLRRCTQLTRLELSANVTSTGIRAIDSAAIAVLRGLVHLKVLRLCGAVTSGVAQSLAAAIDGMRALQQATLQLEAAALRSIVPALRRHAMLRHVAVVTDWQPDRAEAELRDLLALTRLQRLELAGFDWSQLPDVFAGTAAASCLQALHLRSCGAWRSCAAGAANLSPLIALRELSAPGVRLDAATSAALAAALACQERLTFLDLSQAGVQEDAVHGLESIFRSITGVRSLRLDKSFGFGITHSAAAAFAQLSALSHLSARSSVNFCSAECLRAMAALPQLRRLDLRDAKGEDRLLRDAQAPAMPVPAFSALTWLSTKHSSVGGLKAEFIANAAHMRNLRYWEMGDSAISARVGSLFEARHDGSVAALARVLPTLSALEFLGLKGARVDAEGASALSSAFAAMPCLLHVDMRNNLCFFRMGSGVCDLTDDGAQQDASVNSSQGVVELRKALAPTIARGSRLTIRCSKGISADHWFCNT